MPVFDENGKQILKEDEFPKLQDPEEAGDIFKPAKKGFPILPAALGIIALIFAVVAVFYMIKATTLEQDLDILKKAKTQLASTEVKLQEITKENNKLRTEVSQARSEMDTIRAKNQALEDQLARKKAAALAPPKKDAKVTAKKTPPKR